MNKKISISSDFIKLDSLLKFAGMTDSGGEAKAAIQDGKVTVNGEACTQRGKKIYPGDTVTYGADTVTVGS
ncbi:MAG: RNA-binding S4 domain-containing protein [Clostridiales bacterium]|nr:RNA-binding S4 domain-containing protein [Clostridiales bacterium]